jgi:hypothetical protein
MQVDVYAFGIMLWEFLAKQVCAVYLAINRCHTVKLANVRINLSQQAQLGVACGCFGP